MIQMFCTSFKASKFPCLTDAHLLNFVSGQHSFVILVCCHSSFRNMGSCSVKIAEIGMICWQCRLPANPDLEQGPVVRSLVSANRWLRGIKMYRFPWYLTLVSTNHASSNPGQNVALWRRLFDQKIIMPRTSRNSKTQFTFRKVRWKER